MEHYQFLLLSDLFQRRRYLVITSIRHFWLLNNFNFLDYGILFDQTEKVYNRCSSFNHLFVACNHELLYRALWWRSWGITWTACIVLYENRKLNLLFRILFSSKFKLCHQLVYWNSSKLDLYNDSLCELRINKDYKHSPFRNGHAFHLCSI